MTAVADGLVSRRTRTPATSSRTTRLTAIRPRRTAATALRGDDADRRSHEAGPQPDHNRTRRFETAVKRIRFHADPEATKLSGRRPYFTETGEAEFQQGATIVPHVLTIA